MKQIFKIAIIFLLELEAKLILKKYKPQIFAVTGNVGKTTTKDAVYTVLSPSLHVRKSEKSFNSEIGIPLTILGVENAWSNPFHWIKNLFEGAALILLKSHYPNVLVLEVGADRPGDIKHTASWITPDVVVLTRFPDIPVHVEFFDSPEHVIEEKMHLIHALKEGGTLIVNFDDEKMKELKAPEGGKRITYGFNDGADLKASKTIFTYKKGNVTGISFRVDYGNVSIPISIQGALGRQHIYPILAALALGVGEGINIVTLGESLGDYAPPPGRMRLIPAKNGGVVIDDTYNASPIAVGEALDTLGALEVKGRKIAVLADMMELGSYSVDAHKAAGKRAAEVSDLLLVVGIRSHYTAEQAQKSGLKKKDIRIFDDAEAVGNALVSELEEGDVVLVKGSQSLRMERVVEKLMENPEKKKELLVRQDVEWLRKG